MVRYISLADLIGWDRIPSAAGSVTHEELDYPAIQRHPRQPEVGIIARAMVVYSALRKADASTNSPHLAMDGMDHCCAPFIGCVCMGGKGEQARTSIFHTVEQGCGRTDAHHIWTAGAASTNNV
jgi:hypothetical protein